MIEGGIVLIDGIENAPFQIIEKILGLCEGKRRLDLFELGEKYYFSEDAENKEQKIHKDFYLFITYNPENQIEKKSIEVLLNKCISFSIPEIDIEQKFIAQVFYGIFINNNFSKKDAENISLKLSKIHELAKEKSIINNSELIAGNIPFNGRSLIYVSRFFNKLKYKNLDKFSKSIKDGIINIYLKPFIKLKNDQQDIIKNQKSEKEKFKEELFKIFQKESNYIDFNILTQNEDDINLTNFLNYLSKIESQVINKKEKNNKKEIEFNLSNFINNICQYLKIKYLFYAEKDKNIIENIKKTIGILNENKLKLSENDLINCFQLNLILNCFEEIINSNNNATKKLGLNENQINTILKFKLLNNLIQNIKYFAQKMEYFLYMNKNISGLCILIQKLYEEETLDNFNNLIEFLLSNNELFKTLKLIFPFNKFQNKKYKLLPFWIDIMINLYNKKVNYTIYINEKEYLFEFNHNPDKIEIILIFEDENTLELCEESYIQINDYGIGSKLSFINSINYSKLIYHIISDVILKMEIDDIKSETILRYIQDNHQKFEEKNFGNQFLSLNFLFKDKQKEYTLIGKCWNIIYNLPNEVIQYLQQFSLDEEKELLTIVKEKFNKLEEKNETEYIDFTKSLINYFNEKSALWEWETIYLENDLSNKSEKELNSFIEKCNMEEKEIKNLNKKGIKISTQKFMDIKNKFNEKLNNVRINKKKKKLKKSLRN